MMVMTSARLNNSLIITPTGHFYSRVMNLYLSPFKIFVIMLLVLLELSTVVVIAAPLRAVVIPITRSPNIALLEQISTQSEPFRNWFYDDKRRYDEKQCGENEKNKRSPNYRDKHYDKDQNWEHCSKNQFDKPFDIGRHEKQYAKNQNGGDRHGMNFFEQNKQQKMKNDNKHKELNMDNKVIVNVNNDQTVLTPSLALLQLLETTEPMLVSTMYGSVEQRSSFCKLWIIVILCLLMYCMFSDSLMPKTRVK